MDNAQNKELILRKKTGHIFVWPSGCSFIDEAKNTVKFLIKKGLPMNKPFLMNEIAKEAMAIRVFSFLPLK